MKMYEITAPEFGKYGRVVTGVDVTGLLARMEETPLPEDVVYEPSVMLLEEDGSFETLQRVIYGELPIQVGYCNGNNYDLNALEYHRSSEVDIAATDLILLLGRQQDIREDFTYDTAQVEAFYVPAGTAVELYATTLHYAPCNAKESGFRCVIVLPKDTNLPLEKTHTAEGEDRLLTARNKWLIGHKEGGLPEGSPIGLVGENLSVRGI